VAGNDNFIDSLHRETFEEAGLNLAELLEAGARLEYVGKVASQRHLNDGLLVEDLLVWQMQLQTAKNPHLTVQPVNKDGEVAQFDLVPTSTLNRLIQQRQITLEAAVCIQLCKP
jgi:8-oxo-dGTP pyrophosphatase MutT (NUDIX family)